MPVYMIRCGDMGPIKIGWSINPKVRLGELQVAHFETLRIIRLFQGGEVEEAALHARFADHHLRGEWHSFSRAMLGDLGLVEMPVGPAPEPIVVPDTHGGLLVVVERFLEMRSMPATTFGIQAVNDGKFVSRLRAGVNMTTSTISRVSAYLQAAP